ncbi:hypothetical protein AAZV13_07G144750 [Glycine max]
MLLLLLALKDGYFKIRRGTYECGIKEDVTAGLPSTKNLVREVTDMDADAAVSFRMSWLIDIGGFAKKVKSTTLSSATCLSMSSSQHWKETKEFATHIRKIFQVLRKMGVMSICFTEQSMHMLLVNESIERFIINRV